MVAPRHRVAALAVAVFGALLVAPGLALAGKGQTPPPDVSAVSQYVEVIPTGGGGTASGIEKPHSKVVSKRIRAPLARQGGRDAAKLREVVSSSAFGAPEQRIVQTPRPGTANSRDALSAAISASGTGSHALWLLAILAATTVAALIITRLSRSS